MDLTGRVAVVTGAGGSIGGAIVEKLEENGVTCVRVDRDFDLGCDFSLQDEVEKLASEIIKKYPKIDYLFNVAGVGIYKSLEKLSLKEWNDSFSINVTSAFILSKILLPALKESGKGLIFNIGSGMGVIPASGRISYCSSKFALRGFSLSLAKELKKEKIDVCILTLGSVMTPFGSGGIDKRKELERAGKKYLTTKEVANKIFEIVISDNKEEEYVFYPEGYI